MSTLTLKVQQERRHVGDGQQEHVVVTVQAGAAEGLPRPVLDLVGCIDISGSMSGGKLDRVKHAMQEFVRHLQAGDRLGLVTFTDDASEMSPCVDMVADNKQTLLEVIRRLRTRGSTNMAAGALQSFKTLGAERRLVDGRPVVSRVILFTDGHANVGLGADDRRGWRDRILSERGPHSLSCIGFGEDHDSDFLGYLAEVGHGHAYQAIDERAILDTFASELGGLLSLIGQNVTLRVRVRGGVELHPVGEAITRNVDGWLEIPLDTLSAGESRSVLFSCRMLPGTVGAECALEAELAWREVATGEARTARQQTAWLRVEPDRVDSPDSALRAPILQREAVWVLTEATRLAEAGQFAEAVRWIDGWIERARAVDSDTLRARVVFMEKQRALFVDERTFHRTKGYRTSSGRSLWKEKSYNRDSDDFLDSEAKWRMKMEFAERDRSGNT